MMRGVRSLIDGITVSLVIFLGVLFMMPVVPVHAAPCEPNKSLLGLPTWYKYVEGETDSRGRCMPKLNNSNSALPIGLALLEGAVRLSGLVAAGMVIWGSFKFILSRGEPDKAVSARTMIINALVGLVIVIASASIISFFGSRLGA